LGLAAVSPPLCPGSGKLPTLEAGALFEFEVAANTTALLKLPVPPRVAARFTVPLMETASDDEASPKVEERSLPPGTAAEAFSVSTFLFFLEFFATAGAFPDLCAFTGASLDGFVDVDSSATFFTAVFSAGLSGREVEMAEGVGTSAAGFVASESVELKST
jgi:hypothetical protein